MSTPEGKPRLPCPRCGERVIQSGAGGGECAWCGSPLLSREDWLAERAADLVRSGVAQGAAWRQARAEQRDALAPADA